MVVAVKDIEKDEEIVVEGKGGLKRMESKDLLSDRVVFIE
jgi:hypothetical protein